MDSMKLSTAEAVLRTSGRVTSNTAATTLASARGMKIAARPRSRRNNHWLSTGTLSAAAMRAAPAITPTVDTTMRPRRVRWKHQSPTAPPKG